MVARLLMHPVMENVLTLLTVSLTLLSVMLIASLVVLPSGDDRTAVSAARTMAAAVPMAERARIVMVRSCVPVSGAFPRPPRVDCRR